MRYGRVCILLAALCSAGCGGRFSAPQGPTPTASKVWAPDPLAPIVPVRTAADRIVNRAKQEVRDGVTYDASYRTLTYPGGDVPAGRGACTDVVIRSLRAADLDLQRAIHEDIESHYNLYPHHWEIRRPDANIDHRRGANHIVYFRRHARTLTTETDAKSLAAWLPGDLVYWKLGNNLDHCGVVSNVRNAQGVPLVIHNIGEARQEDCLTTWKIAAHFRCVPR